MKIDIGYLISDFHVLSEVGVPLAPRGMPPQTQIIYFCFVFSEVGVSLGAPRHATTPTSDPTFDCKRTFGSASINGTKQIEKMQLI